MPETVLHPNTTYYKAMVLPWADLLKKGMPLILRDGLYAVTPTSVRPSPAYKYLVEFEIGSVWWAYVWIRIPSGAHGSPDEGPDGWF